MELTTFLIGLLVLQGIYFVGSWKIYQAAGRAIWEAVVPGYSFFVLIKIINRPFWWGFLLFIPVINLLLLPVLWVETARSFGYNTRKDTLLAIFTLGFYLIYLNYFLPLNYITDRSLKPRSRFEESLGSLLFAVIAATLVHTYVMQPFIIPTSSLEKSLLVGDFLFVSKFHYGARVPSTLVAAPMVHDTLPLIKTRSYLKKPQLPYLRLPGFQKIKRNEIVVFNWPADTVQQFFKTPDKKIIKPIDKKSNYVKRCVALPGDTLQIISGDLYINGKISKMPERAKPQFYYEVTLKNGQRFSAADVYKKYKVRRGEGYLQGGKYVLNMDAENARKVAADYRVKSVQKKIMPAGISQPVFPKNERYSWNIDHYGPIYIPQKNATVALTLENLPLYKRLITAYENHDLTVKNGEIFIDGTPAEKYTFAQDYYWMMGDNRQNSEDSRFWGFVPFDHIVGKPVFVWMSLDFDAKGLFNKIRWERFFTTVHGEGKPVSYLYYFLALVAIYQGFRIYKKRKAA